MNILRKPRILLFWLALIGFFIWDWHASQAVNLRLEPPVIAIGSGQAPSGGHCTNF